jgi:CPA1 family monovalent cation:H+ antiporter
MRAADIGEAVDVYDDVERHYQHRLASVNSPSSDEGDRDTLHYRQYLDLSRALLDVERRTALRLRDQGHIMDEVLREIEHELDLSETRLIASQRA